MLLLLPGEYVEKALGQHHTGIYGLGEWREPVDETTGEAFIRLVLPDGLVLTRG